MSVNLSISTEEAQVMLFCLRFIRQNIVVDGSASCFRFVNGKPFAMSLREGVSLDFLRDYVESKTIEAINSHPLNPYVNIF